MSHCSGQVTELGSEALVVGASVGKREDIDRMYKEVADKWGRVDVLVNNAGGCRWVHIILGSEVMHLLEGVRSCTFKRRAPWSADARTLLFAWTVHVCEFVLACLCVCLCARVSAKFALYIL